MVAFLTLAEERHVGRTAVRLGVSRQTVSRRVARLEELLGESLVTRSTRRVELTEVGALLRDEAGPALRAMDEALQRIRLGVGRRLSIAISTDLGHRWEARVQDWIVRRGTPVLLEQRAPDDAIALLRADKLDLALLTAELQDLPCVTVAHEPTVALVPAEHPAATQRCLRPGDARDLLVAVTDAGAPAHHRATVALLHGDPDLPYVVAPRVGTIFAGLVQVARTHRAAALVLRHNFEEVDVDGLVGLPLEPPYAFPVTLAARPGLGREPFDALAEHLRRPGQ
ncbi:LysR family transcriptional regulator [Solirubrobacter phytolaccae]|uniref:LysR family transcriptional regulator n=2 Tax=Solirubrobacter phytolaccae TaxID=1404360 RepID=A0A9X3NC92_9ACTN|nr:LysR family transcriptional regulator [Solirubrobacter phytolaccae]